MSRARNVRSVPMVLPARGALRTSGTWDRMYARAWASASASVTPFGRSSSRPEFRCISVTKSLICARASAGGLMTMSTPSPKTLSSGSVTSTASSMRASVPRSRPVISQSIHTRLSTPTAYVSALVGADGLRGHAAGDEAQEPRGPAPREHTEDHRRRPKGGKGRHRSDGERTERVARVGQEAPAGEELRTTHCRGRIRAERHDHARGDAVAEAKEAGDGDDRADVVGEREDREADAHDDHRGESDPDPAELVHEGAAEEEQGDVEGHGDGVDEAGGGRRDPVCVAPQGDDRLPRGAVSYT